MECPKLKKMPPAFLKTVVAAECDCVTKDALYEARCSCPFRCSQKREIAGVTRARQYTAAELVPLLVPRPYLRAGGLCYEVFEFESA